MPKEPEVITMLLSEYRKERERISDAAYTRALLELQNLLRKENPNPSAPIKAVLKHIQDLIWECPNCGTKMVDFIACPTCVKRNENPS